VPASLWVTRILFAGLIAIEAASLVGFLHLQGEYNWFGGLILTALVAWAATEAAVHFTFREQPSRLPFYLPLLPVAAVYFDALGDFVRWYAQFTWYDRLTHFAGGVAVAGLLYTFFKSWMPRHNYPVDHAALAFVTVSVTALIGSLYEIEEYLEDYFRHIAMRLGDGPDTASDLLFNLLGAVLIVVLIMVSSKSPRLKNN